jgi:hypothetical protein
MSTFFAAGRSLYNLAMLVQVDFNEDGKAQLYFCDGRIVEIDKDQADDLEERLIPIVKSIE